MVACPIALQLETHNLFAIALCDKRALCAFTFEHYFHDNDKSTLHFYRLRC